MNTEALFLFGFKGVLFLWILAGVSFVNRWIADGPNHHYVFSYLIGSFASAVILSFVYTMSLPWFKTNPFLMGIGVIVVVAFWKFLFGPWRPNIKASVLGTFLFWIAVDILQKSTDAERTATLLAAIIALIPAIIWCLLFLQNHRARLSIVFLSFLAGMLSTAPILFYDHVVRGGYELHFFLFRITPENFLRSSETFVTQYLTGQRGVVATSLGVTIVSFVLVAVIEEWSKHWVTRNSDLNFFRSIDDVIQLSIIAAIGFAFAENIINPTYFIAFVKDYLVVPDTPQWGSFLGSVFGRSIITNMVHITSSGVLGYYYGLAFFAQPYLEYKQKQGRRFRFVSWVHRVFQVKRWTVYRDEKMMTGLFLAIFIHGLFNTLTSLSDILPGRPSSLGDLFKYDGIFSGMSIIALPAIIYVFGGWFLLMYLFRKKDHIKDFGRRVSKDVFVSEPLPA